ncbi:hypothetical protein BG015_005761 [Linnemannia schmuckeri]|uniref:F-box domain-containing protein n=1 Tax=Linnemannia schmuckeri TaxID=64567 RepID=A0A9P5S411_9FUNG|nr:hypothetical protein BG015_005761 [Linnemannia schmuckeri]
MSILNIPELADLVASYISPHDLTVCIRVNKTWNTTFVPHLWHTVPPTAHLSQASRSKCSELFRLAIRSDFLASQEQDPPQGNSNKVALSSSSPSSFLSKYGPWIHRLTIHQSHLICPKTTSTTASTIDPNPHQANPEPTERELLLHLFRYCPNLHSLYLFQWSGTDIDLDFWRAIARDVVPGVDIDYDDHYYNEFVTDADIASILSAGRKGWRNVSLPTLGTLSAEALVHHSTTLASLQVKNTPGFTSAHMCQILSSSPHLHTFTTLEDGECENPHVSYLLAEDFIDRDSVTNTLRPWACESTLKRLRAKILGIPRPDVTETYDGWTRGEPEEENEEEEGHVEVVLQETHPGQGRELQAHVYERLSRFTRLEVLGLGHDDRDFGNEGNFVQIPTGEWVLKDQEYQYECLEMSLDSGLQKLETLKDLEEVNVTRMATCIGVEEVKWMRRAWPRLKTLDGLNDERNEEAAEEWLRENCPEIQSKPCALELLI